MEGVEPSSGEANRKIFYILILLLNLTDNYKTNETLPASLLNLTTIHRLNCGEVSFDDAS